MRAGSRRLCHRGYFNLHIEKKIYHVFSSIQHLIVYDKVHDCVGKALSMAANHNHVPQLSSSIELALKIYLY